MKNKVEPGIYSNGVESFHITQTDVEEIMELNALTDISYFPIRKGETIPLNMATVDSIINDKDLKYKKIIKP